MKRVGLLLILLLAGCQFDTRPSLETPISGTQGGTFESPSGRYTAQLSFCCGSAISSFEITDHETKQRARQDLLADGSPGTLLFWMPNEHYVLIISGKESTSHGCDELLVYSADGARLVFDTTHTLSVCRQSMVDQSLRVMAICPDDTIYVETNVTYRIDLTTGAYRQLEDGDQSHVISGVSSPAARDTGCRGRARGGRCRSDRASARGRVRDRADCRARRSARRRALRRHRRAPARPVRPRSSRSGKPPTAVATTGQPAASDSITLTGVPSLTLLITLTSRSA